MHNLLINGSLDKIIITGYTEKKDIYEFKPMFWWLYLEIDNKLILLDTNDGDILIKQVASIDCQFDIEEDDWFTISSWSKEEYGIINFIDLFYDENGNLIYIGMGLQEGTKYIFFDSLCIDGFEINQYYKRHDLIKALRFSEIKTLGVISE